MITLTAPESFGFLKGATLSAGYTTGPNTTPGAHEVDQFYAGGTIPLPVTGLSLGWAYDYSGDLAVGAQTHGYANSIAGYLMWQATEKLKLNGRLDYGSATTGWYAVQGGPGAHRIGSFTATADYSLWKNVISRAEFRWDHALDGSKPYGGETAGAPTQEQAVSLALNLIYQF
jgi:predicted porin